MTLTGMFVLEHVDLLFLPHIHLGVNIGQSVLWEDYISI